MIHSLKIDYRLVNKLKQSWSALYYLVSIITFA